jgi:8-amino-3,8-dideoxy-alpha-D-manno-octulosonate transaminase
MNKPFTSGEGGAVVTNNEALFRKALAIHDVGYGRDGSGNLLVNDQANQFWGVGCRMSEITAAILRVQLRKLPNIVAEMRRVKMRLKSVVRGYPSIKLRRIDDPAGDIGSFLKMRFKSRDLAIAFASTLETECEKINGLYSILMGDWGLHLYSNNSSLVNRKSICGHHSVWERSENSFASAYRYDEGSLPFLDALAIETLVFPTPIGLEEDELAYLQNGFTSACTLVESAA